MRPAVSESTSAPAKPQTLLKHVGPGLVTACVVIGPGSILTSSTVGAANGYSLAWIVILACLFMMVYTTMAAKLGVISGTSTCQLVADRAGRWLAVLIGASVFFISAAFQFGNNLGVHSAFAAYIDFKAHPSLLLGPIIVFNALALLFLFSFRNLYKLIERLMAIFVGVMLVAFAVNLIFAKPNIIELLTGFIPLAGSDKQLEKLDLKVMGLVGTTFVITAAYYQSYLVRFKGWKQGDLNDGLIDARVSATIMALITLMLMCTAGAVLRDQSLSSVGDVAEGLRPTFGSTGHLLFCIGLFSAAYSSFLVNSMIGGFILADGLGMGSTPDDIRPRIMTAAVLLSGAGVGAYTVIKGSNPVPAIIAAQAVTVLAAPLVAGTLWWLANREDIMGAHRNGPVLNTLAAVGFVMLLGIAANTAINGIPSQIAKLRAPAAAEATDTPDDSADSADEGTEP